jgi:hypothetical protein
MTLDDARPGLIAWRVGSRSGEPLRCEIVRAIRPGINGPAIEVRASRFARNSTMVAPQDLFADREACRAEINRRAEQ